MPVGRNLKLDGTSIYPNPSQMWYPRRLSGHLKRLSLKRNKQFQILFRCGVEDLPRMTLALLYPSQTRRLYGRFQVTLSWLWIQILPRDRLPTSLPIGFLHYTSLLCFTTLVQPLLLIRMPNLHLKRPTTSTSVSRTLSLTKLLGRLRRQLRLRPASPDVRNPG